MHVWSDPERDPSADLRFCAACGHYYADFAIHAVTCRAGYSQAVAASAER